MKKTFLIVICSFIIGLSLVYAQPTISCPAVNAGPDTTLTSSNCVRLQASVVSGFQPTSYTVSQIPYNPYPFNVGNPILLNIDDIWSAVITLPFNFCFYGNTYNQCVIGSNGALSFDLTYAGNFMAWAIAVGIPGNNDIRNSITCPFHDIDPSIAGTIRWALYGTAPCRVFVVSFDQCAMFSCTAQRATQQIAIYETTNMIETYIQNKPLCATWNGGKAIHGIQNANATQAVVVPGRNNPTQWSASNDAWRFTPAGAPNFIVNWFQVGNPIPIATTDTVTVCPAACNTSYYAVATYTNCNGATVTVSDTMNVFMNNQNAQTNPTIVQPLCFGNTTGSISLNPSGGFGGYVYNWPQSGATTSIITGLGAGTYNVIITDSAGCLLLDTFNIVEPPLLVPTATSTNVQCFGGSTGTGTVNVAGGTPVYTYLWTPTGGTNATATGLPIGQYIIRVTDANGCVARDTIVISQPPQINTTVTTVPVLCNGGNTGQATATTTGGTGSMTYWWTPSSQSGSTVTNLTAGSHSVMTTDSFGCTSATNFSVSQPSAISIVITRVNVTCNGGSNGSATVVASGGTPGYTYSWSPSGATNATASNLSAGSHTCTVTDANGCVSTATILVLEPSPLTTVAYATNEICQGFCDGTVTVVPGGGTGPYTYLWSTGATTASVANLCSGTYSVTVTDALNCVKIDQATVGFNPSPIADAGPDVSFCEGDGGVQLTGTASGGGGAPYYYSWTCSNPPCGLSCVNCPNPWANPTDTMTYYLVVTDRNGCQSAPDSVVVNVKPKPIVNAGPDVSICGVPAPCTILTPTISNGFGPYTYTWLPPTGLSNPSILNPCARPDTTTIYALVVTDLSTGCTSDYTTTDTLSTVKVTVSPVPIANAGPDRIICRGDTAQLQSTGSGAGPVYSYQWSPITGLDSYTIANPFSYPSLTTHYSLTVWSNGCPSIGDTVVVYVTEIPTVDAGQNRDICAGDSAFLDGNAAVSNQVIPDSIFSYLWTPAIGLSSDTLEDVWAAPPQTTMYYLNVMSAYGCANKDSVLVTVNPSPIVDAGLNITVCGGNGPFNLDGTINWVNNNRPVDQQNILMQWQPASFVVGPNNVEDVSVDTDSTMWFYFTVTYNLCSHTDSVLVTVINEVVATAKADTNTICSGDSVLLTATGGLGGASYQWTPSTGLANPNQASTMASPATTTTYNVQVSEGGCLGEASVTVNVIPTPSVAFANSFSEGCAPLGVSFTSLTSNAILYTWDFGDGSPRENGASPFHTYQSPGVYQVMLYGVNTGGCNDSSSTAVTITVHDTATVDFHSDPSYPVELVIPGSVVNFFDDSRNAKSWMWDFGTGFQSSEQNPSYAFGQPGQYFVSLFVTNSNGCTGKVIHGPYIIKAPDLFVPNVFTPNDDGVNDFFLVDYSGNQPFVISIFDRWGVKQFESRNKLQGWNGSNATGEVVEGVYYYTLRIGNRDFNGNLTLMK